MPVVLALERLRQNCHVFESNLDDTVSPCLLVLKPGFKMPGMVMNPLIPVLER